MNKIERYEIDLLWIPLGAGGWFVRFNGRIWETIQAKREKRTTMDLYHTALEIHLPEGRYVVENAWPIPDSFGYNRGVKVEGPIFNKYLGVFRAMRYEVRCWPNGIIYDAKWAVGGPRQISNDPAVAQRVLKMLTTMPPKVWGRKVKEADDMWNSNSTIAWVLTRSGIFAKDIKPPIGGRAPGWEAGINVALKEMSLVK
ncbi:MAG: hypothetical protein WD022_08500 [Balneolaceae bacterium]